MLKTALLSKASSDLDRMKSLNKRNVSGINCYLNEPIVIVFFTFSSKYN